MDQRSLRAPLRRTALLVCMGAMLLAGPLAEHALAQPKELPGKGAGGGLPVAITGNAPEAMSSAYNNVMTELTRTGVVAFMNALQVFFGQLAYDAANYIASGGNGQAAVFYKKGFGDYIKSVASDSAGEFMGYNRIFQHAGLIFVNRSSQPLENAVCLETFPGNESLRAQNQNVTLKKSRRVRIHGEAMSNEDVFKNIQANFDGSNDIGIAASVFNYNSLR